MMTEEVASTGTGGDCDGRPADEIPIPCFRCGVCCTCYQAPLDDREIESIASSLGISDAEFIGTYALKVPINEGYLLRKRDSGCVFLEWEGERARCIIYPSRPQACREWQPGLSRPACLQGLARLRSRGRLKELDELLGAAGARREFCLSLERALAGTGQT